MSISLTDVCVIPALVHLFFAPIDAPIDALIDAEPFPSGGTFSYEPVRLHNAAVRATGGPHSTVGRPDQR